MRQIAFIIFFSIIGMVGVKSQDSLAVDKLLLENDTLLVESDSTEVTSSDSLITEISDTLTLDMESDSLTAAVIIHLNKEYGQAKKTKAMDLLLIKLKDEVLKEIQQEKADSVRRTMEKMHNDSLNNHNMSTYIRMEQYSDSLITDVRTFVELLPYMDIYYPEDTILLNQLFYPIVVPNNYIKKDRAFYDLSDSFRMKVPTFKLPLPQASYNYTASDSLAQGAINNVINNYPRLVEYTEAMLPKDAIAPKEISVKSSFNSLLKEKPEIQKAEMRSIDLPNAKLWSTKGRLTTQFSQSYMSKNWFQGGANAASIFNTLNFDANFNNRKNITLTNNVNYKLGLTTIPHDDEKDYQINTDYFRMTSQLSLRAIKSWSYTINADLSTQCFSARSGETVKATLLSPGTFNISVGMNYSYRTKNGKFSMSLYISPLVYNNKFVMDTAMVNPTRHGIRAGHTCTESLNGLLVTSNLNWTISREVNYSGRIKYFSPYDQALIEFENTLNFSVNRYLTTTFYWYLRYDDGRTLQEGEDSYLQFKENFSFGLTLWW